VEGEIVRSGDEIKGMNLAMLRYNGRDYHPIFTSFTRLRAAAPDEQRHFTAIGRDLFRRTKGADFALNPRSELGKLLTANEIAFWLDPSARARRTLARNQPHAIITVPAEPHKVLTEALSVLFANRREVVSAYALDVVFSDRSEPPHPLIVIEAEGPWAKVATEVSQLAAAIVPDLILDVIPLDRTEPNAQLTQPLSESRPFFQRKSTE
jgi:hypothetical protein